MIPDTRICKKNFLPNSFAREKGGGGGGGDKAGAVYVRLCMQHRKHSECQRKVFVTLVTLFVTQMQKSIPIVFTICNTNAKEHTYCIYPKGEDDGTILTFCCNIKNVRHL